jgi:subtilisin family serine protease
MEGCRIVRPSGWFDRVQCIRDERGDALVFPATASDETGPAPRDKSRLLLGLREPAAPPVVERWVTGAGFAVEKAPATSGGAINHTATRYWLRSRSRRPISARQLRQLRDAVGARLAWFGPVYRCGVGSDGLFCRLPDALLVLAPAARLSRAALRRLGLDEDPELSRYQAGFRYCRVRKPLTRPSWDLRKTVMARASVADCRHEHMPMVVPVLGTSNDPMLDAEWHLARIGAVGPGRSGWDISMGDPGVVIAVIDSGGDLEHPDLAFSGQGVDLGTMRPPGTPKTAIAESDPKKYAHGTLAAGVAAAAIGDGRGPAGVAGRCRVLPLSFDAWTDCELARGIAYAAEQGARVISMSLGQLPKGRAGSKCSKTWQPAVVDPAVAEAVARGCLLCAAAGNANTSTIMYPARNASVMAIGASDDTDHRCNDPDGQGWGSDWGPELSVVAPGIHIISTDTRGRCGRNIDGGPCTIGNKTYPTSGDAAGDYFFQYGGTSAATPQVAAVAAAIWSIRPRLAAADVRAIIERTADKVGGVPYANDHKHVNGTWHPEMGYGRLNMLRALEMALTTPPSSPGHGRLSREISVE